MRVCTYKDSTITAKEQKQSGQNKTYSTGRAKPWSKQYSAVMTSLCNKTCEACNNHQTKTILITKRKQQRRMEVKRKQGKTKTSFNKTVCKEYTRQGKKKEKKKTETNYL